MASYRTHSSAKFKALTPWRATSTIHLRGRVWKSLEGIQFVQMCGITHNAFQETKELEFLLKRRKLKWQLAGLQKQVPLALWRDTRNSFSGLERCGCSVGSPGPV